MYRAPADNAHVSSGELAYIEQDPHIALQRVPWSQLLRYPGTWVYIGGGVLTNPA